MHLDRMPYMMEHVEARTWIQPADRAKCERDFAFYSGDERILMCRSIWAVMSHETGRIRSYGGTVSGEMLSLMNRLPEVVGLQRSSKDFQRRRDIGSYTIRSADIDLGGHMNNVNYIRAALAVFHRKNCSASMGIQI